MIKQLTSGNDLFELEKNNFDDYYSLASCKEELNNDSKFYFCYEEDKKIVGYIGIMIALDQAEILRIAVNENYRRRKIAQKLLDFSINFLKNRKIFEIFLEVSEKNQVAINFYNKNNFNIKYIRKNYYGENNNALILSRSI